MYILRHAPGRSHSALLKGSRILFPFRAFALVVVYLREWGIIFIRRLELLVLTYSLWIAQVIGLDRPGFGSRLPHSFL